MEQDGIAKNHYIKLSNVADTQGILKVRTLTRSWVDFIF